MGGRGSSGGGGKGRSGGGVGKAGKGITISSESFASGNYSIGGSVKYRETDTRYTTENGESISKSANRILDSRVVNNSDSTTSRTDIIRGSKGNLYAVELTYTRNGVIRRKRVNKATKA